MQEIKFDITKPAILLKDLVFVDRKKLKLALVNGRYTVALRDCVNLNTCTELILINVAKTDNTYFKLQLIPELIIRYSDNILNLILEYSGFYYRSFEHVIFCYERNGKIVCFSNPKKGNTIDSNFLHQFKSINVIETKTYDEAIKVSKFLHDKGFDFLYVSTEKRNRLYVIPNTEELLEATLFKKYISSEIDAISSIKINPIVWENAFFKRLGMKLLSWDQF